MAPVTPTPTIPTATLVSTLAELPTPQLMALISDVFKHKGLFGWAARPPNTRTIPRLAVTSTWLIENGHACGDGAREAVTNARRLLGPDYRVDEGVRITLESLDWMLTNRPAGTYYLANGCGLVGLIGDRANQPISELHYSRDNLIARHITPTWLYLQILNAAQTHHNAAGLLINGTEVVAATSAPAPIPA